MALTETQVQELAEHGVSEAEYHALRPEDQLALLAETPDDTKHVTDEEAAAADAKRAAELAQPQATPEPTSAPVTTPAPTPAPTAAPVAQTDPVTTPQPTAAPVAQTEAPRWRAVENDPLGVDIGNDIKPPPVLLTAADEAKITATEAKLDELTEKFTDGDLTAEEYKAQKKTIEAELRDLTGKQAAQIGLQAQYAQSVQEAFQASLEASFAMAKASGIDYADPKNAPLLQELDAAVKRLAQAAPLMNPGKPAVWLDKWALAQAHKEVASAHGFTFRGAPGAPNKETPGQRAAPDLSLVPPTLRGAPNAADANIQTDEFAALDSMTPAAAEKMVATFDDAKMARYLAR